MLGPDDLEFQAALRPIAGEASVNALRAEAVSDLEAARARVDQRLASTIAALETIRLDLLRLHAGRGSTQDLTAALNAAMRIGDEVSLTIEAQGIVESIS